MALQVAEVLLIAAIVICLPSSCPSSVLETTQNSSFPALCPGSWAQVHLLS